MEHKSFAFEEIKAEGEGRMIEGWASIFNNVDGGNDIVLPGAFAKTLSRRKASDPVVMLWQHDTREPVGVWHELREIDKGLYTKGEIFDTARGEDAYKLLKGRAIRGLSIGYSPKQYEIDRKKGTRKLSEVELFEVSLVTFPMNDKAQVTRVKSEDGLLATEREFEEFLRDAGRLSQREAMTVISKGYRALLKHREGDAVESIAAAEKVAELLTKFKM